MLNNDPDGNVESKIIIMGDFNTVFEDEHEFLAFCELHKLVDINLSQNETSSFDTYARVKDCINFCLVTNNLCPDVTNFRHTPFVTFFCFDHRGKFLTFWRKPCLFQFLKVILDVSIVNYSQTDTEFQFNISTRYIL